MRASRVNKHSQKYIGMVAVKYYQQQEKLDQRRFEWCYKKTFKELFSSN